MAGTQGDVKTALPFSAAACRELPSPSVVASYARWFFRLLLCSAAIFRRCQRNDTQNDTRGDDRQSASRQSLYSAVST